MKGERYRDSIFRGLDGAVARAESVSWDVDRTPVIVFSDHHRGQGDHADDFRTCESTYRAALEHYLAEGYRLVTLGDAEELWEGWPGKVVPHSRRTLELENRFHGVGDRRLLKIWGNHDDLWRYPAQVERHLGPVFGELAVPEAVTATIVHHGRRLGRILLVHGHQGTGSSDRWGGVSRHFVRWVWRPIQRLFKISLNTPATDFDIRTRHDRAMYEWAASRNDLILVAGHTHNPVFVSVPHLATLERVQEHLCATPGHDGERSVESDIRWAKSEVRTFKDGVSPRARSCYFNTGCCCFSNGDITGIELADGELRLVRWTAEPMEPELRVLERRPLHAVFAELERTE